MYVYCIFNVRTYTRIQGDYPPTLFVRFINGFIQTLGFLEFLRFVIYSKIKGWFSVLGNNSLSSMDTP